MSVIVQRNAPAPAEVRAARIAVQARLKIGNIAAKTKCAAAVYTSIRAWEQWETDAANKTSHRAMHPAFWDLFNRKVKGGEIN